MELFDVIIIGSGPAGFTAAIYTARANLKTLVLKGNQPGGQLTTTTVIENWPGYADGIDGNELMQQMEKQASRFGAQLVQSTITKLTVTTKPFTVTAGETNYQGRTVIIATGASARTTGAAGEADFLGKGVSTCATCDGFFYRDKNVMIIGGGDTAMEEANFLTKFAKEVTIVHRRDSFRASKIMVDRVKANPKIKVIWNTTVESFFGDTKLRTVVLKNIKTGATQQQSIDGVFLAIGHRPNTEWLRGTITLDKQGYIVIQNETNTNVPGVFVAGDVADERYRQAVTAAGAGCKAAIDVEKYLTETV